MREFEGVVKDAVFKMVIPALGPRWHEQQPPVAVQLIEVFDFLGRILTHAELPPMTAEFALGDTYFREQNRLNRQMLISACVEELKAKYS